MENAHGTHVFGRVYARPNFVPKKPKEVLAQMLAIIEKAGLNPVGQPGCYRFDEFAFTGFIMLAESHVSLHTWYEKGFVDLDVFVCNVTRDNTDTARKIFQAIADLFGIVGTKPANYQAISR